jgi:hypothetical protein
MEWHEREFTRVERQGQLNLHKISSKETYLSDPLQHQLIAVEAADNFHELCSQSSLL